MLHSSTQKLIDRLATMTAKNRIDWSESEDGEVVYATEGYVVRLSMEPPKMVLATGPGKVLEEATPGQLAGTIYDGETTYGDLVTGIVRDAHRVARGTEEAISTLLDYLSEPAPKTRKIIDDSGVREVPLEPEAPRPPVRGKEEAPAREVTSVEKTVEPGQREALSNPFTAGTGTKTSGTPDETSAPEPEDTPETPEAVTGYTVPADEAPVLSGEPDDTAPEAAGVDDAPEPPPSESSGYSYAPFAVDLPVEDLTEDTPAVNAAQAAPVAEADSQGAVPRYVPFGAAGLETAGSDISEAEADEGPAEEPLDSELGPAATMMSLPETPAKPVTEDEETASEGPARQPEKPVETTPSTPATPPSGKETVFHPYARRAQTLPDTQPPQATASEGRNAPETGKDEEAGSPTGGQLGAGHGFGARGGVRPRPPRPAGEAATPAETVKKTPAIIDATDDAPADNRSGVDAMIPDVTSLDARDLQDAPSADAGTRAPHEAAAQTPPAQETSETPAEPAVPRRARGARPKTRFNPWT